MKKVTFVFLSLGISSNLLAMGKNFVDHQEIKAVSFSEKTISELSEYVAQRAVETITDNYEACETTKLLWNLGYADLAREAALRAIQTLGLCLPPKVVQPHAPLGIFETLSVVFKINQTELNQKAVAKAVEIMGDDNSDVRRTLELLHYDWEALE